MVKNYLKVAVRSLMKNKLYSMINIGGLALGMAISFILLLYVSDEYNFDRFNQNSDRLYKVLWNMPGSNKDLVTGQTTPVPLAPALLKDYPEIEQVSRTNYPWDFLISYRNKSLKVSTMAADASLLDMFSFDFVYGNKKTALADLSTVILTESAAKAIFGDLNPIGQIVKYNNKYPLTVSAVIKDNPHNSSFGFKALMSWQTLVAQQPWMKDKPWGDYSYYTYVLLKPGASYNAVNKKLSTIIAHYDPDNKDSKLFMYPLTRLHLYSDFKNGVNAGGKIEYVRLFLMLAIGILIIACINFMNLSTARSGRRAREVGVRKAVGAQRIALIMQFLSESILIAFLSLIMALVLIVLLLPYFNQVINLQLQLPYQSVGAWLVILGVTVFTGFVAGSYPALFLSSFKPVKVLKGQILTPKTTIRPRQILVIIQFTFAICLILSSLFIYKQISYIRDRPVGYDRNGRVEMSIEGSMFNKFELFRQDAINAGAIIDGAATSSSIASNQSNTWGVEWPGQAPEERKLPFDQMAVTFHFLNTYGLTLASGRDFSTESPSDSTAIVLNQAAVRAMRLSDPIGKQVKWQGAQRTVIGVVKDFVWGSPYEPVKPAIIGFMKGWVNIIGLNLNPDQPVSKSLATIQSIYKQYNPEYPFQYRFTDQVFSDKFDNEKLLGTMSAAFTGLAVIISCLGLFGLASFSAEQRRKEIGIRKVLGATTGKLWLILSQEFIRLVLISFIIGSAVSWYYMNQWLTKYTYHTSLSLWVFAITMLMSLAICMLTVSWQAIKSAWTNPVKSLRSE